MKETQGVLDMFDADPMEQLGEVKPQTERLKKLFRVTSCHRVRVGCDYARIDAEVTFAKCQHLQLTFRYERKRQDDDGQGCHIRYSIKLSKNHQQRQNLIVVEVFAPQNFPSAGKAVCINQAMKDGNDDENSIDGWEDIDKEDDFRATSNHSKSVAVDDSKTLHTEQEQQPKQASKRQKISNSPHQESQSHDKDHTTKLDDKTIRTDVKECNIAENDKDDDETPTTDSFLAYLDPDLLQEFLETTGFQTDSEGTAFFLLMTFPFYEHEWDLVGYLLDEIFGFGDDEKEEEESD